MSSPSSEHGPGPAVPGPAAPPGPTSAPPPGGCRRFFHDPLVTGAPRVRWSGVFLMSLLWFANGFHNLVSGTAIVYTLKRYTDDPRHLAFITSLSVIIMLGPIISFLSDQIWTGWGRRKPFLLLAWGAAALAMALIAFLPEVNAALSGLLRAIGLPAAREIVLLIGIIISYTTFYDCSAALEPLSLEVVPPSQRGRFWAMRNMLMNCASLLFFQTFWPVWDQPVEVFTTGYEIGPPFLDLTVTGEQMIYFACCILFSATGLFLLFGVREIRQPKAPNLRPRDVRLGAFVVNFLRDVFLRREWYPYYVILVIPHMANLVWGNLMNVMLTDQFGFSKAGMALMGIPPMLISLAITTPFAGWYSDIKPKLSDLRLCLITLGASACLLGAFALARHLMPQERLELPALWACLVLNTLVALGMMGYFVTIIELILRRARREQMRVWVSTLAVAKDAFFTGLMFLLARYSTTESVPSITLWMVVGQLGATAGTLVSITVGPMIYEFIPRNSFGTVMAGTGLLRGVVHFSMANVGAQWVVFYTGLFGPPLIGKYDYSCLYLLQLIFFIPAILAKLYFLRLVLRGRLVTEGIREIESASPAPVPGKPA